MSGNRIGGQKAARTNLANDPDFYAKIGAKGGRNGATGGFGANIYHYCSEMAGEHKTASCAGKRGGHKSRRRKNGY